MVWPYTGCFGRARVYLAYLDVADGLRSIGPLPSGRFPPGCFGAAVRRFGDAIFGAAAIFWPQTLLVARPVLG